jgi:predicted peroxiredoxin
LARYLLIESRDPFEFSDTTYMYQMANDLAANGNQVTLFLVQNGVFCARDNVKDNPLAGLKENSPSVRVEVDDFSLRERGIATDRLASGVTVSSVDNLVDQLVESETKVVWH